MQARENDRQSGYQKVWDMVLNNYGKVFLINMPVDDQAGIIV
jgi:hypothetical protein